MTTPLDTDTLTRAAYLAQSVTASGTYSDVHEDTKADRDEDEDGNPLDPVNADEVATKIGAVWGVSLDAMWLRAYERFHKSRKVWGVADATARDALGSDNLLTADDLAFKADDQTLWYCVSVDGGSASTWSALTVTGDVTGPASSVDNTLPRFNGTGGKTLQGSGVSVDDSNNLTVPGNIVVSGTVDGIDVAALDAALTAHEADVANPHAVILAQTLTSDGGTGGVGNGITIEAGDYLALEENASSPATPAEGAALWAKNDNTLWWTDDSGGLHAVGDVLAPASPVDNTIPRWDGTDGTLQTSGLIIDDSDNVTVPGSLTLNEASPVLTVGDGTGSTIVRSNKADANVSDISFLNANVDRWILRHDTSEHLALRRYNSSGVFQDQPIQVDQGNGNVTLAQSLSLSSASPTLTVGDGTGSPVVSIKKSDAGGGIISFDGGSGGSGIYWRLASDSGENLSIQRWHNSVFQDNAIEIATATGNVTLANALIIPQIGGRDGSPAITTPTGGQYDIKIKPATPPADANGTDTIIEGSDAAAGVGSPTGGNVKLRPGAGDGGGADGAVIVENGSFDLDENPILNVTRVGSTVATITNTSATISTRITQLVASASITEAVLPATTGEDEFIVHVLDDTNGANLTPPAGVSINGGTAGASEGLANGRYDVYAESSTSWRLTGPQT